MSNITGDVEEGSFSSGNNTGELEVHQENQQQNHLQGSGSGGASGAQSNSNGSVTQQQHQQQQQPPLKKKRNLPGTPDPSAEVIALSPTTLMATNRFVCEICNKGFQRDQNLQLHRRGHNLPWKLRQRTTTEVRKRVYICPEPTCVHHNPARALGDLTGIKKHFSRKHGEKKWKCDKCSKKYAVQSDWKAHQKTCGTREYKCDCGTIFSRRDSFITHRAFCDALAEENNKVNHGLMSSQTQMPLPHDQLISSMAMNTNSSMGGGSDVLNYDISNKNSLNKSFPDDLVPMPFKSMNMNIMAGGGVGGPGMFSSTSGSLFGGPRSVSSASASSLQLSSNNNNNTSSGFNYLHHQETKNGGSTQSNITGAAQMSATALLQKAAQMGATASNSTINSPMMQKSFVSSMAGPDQLSVNPISINNNNNNNNNIRPPSSYDDHHHQFQQQQPPDHHQPHNSHNMVVGGFTNQLMQKGGPQEMSQLFDHHTNSAASSAMTDMGLFNQVFMGISGDPHHHHEISAANNNSSLNSIHGIRINAMERGAMGPSTTLDLLGIGGSRPPNLHEHHQQQQRLDMEAMSQHRLPAITNPFQQQRSHGDSSMEKQIWDV
ncbi:PREDICTED: indeterminate-domain [Prunus dulcis]|uniref:PREDICTED: indeterminate-domain n=1 Tax=Prunus dulcis TaxID=3755 RepID=A0A5E4EEJ4_PRUDU|nr:zinc finger protein GAI-ASSOCIATED FACTOR 1-like [Prunus dulcis]VVA14133.1 PREDICTED: indeterminate-domain [Prunus dulcis]